MEFDSLDALAQHLMQNTVGGFANVNHGLAAAAQLLEDTAKAERGNPSLSHTEAGGFGPWSALKNATEKNATGARKEQKPASALETGAMRDSITHEVGDWEATVGSTDPKMGYHEFGVPEHNLPPRPVFGTALFLQIEKVQKLIGNAAVSGLAGGGPDQEPEE